MIDQIESNDAGFTGIWSDAVHMECGTLFSNPRLCGDDFFNKLSCVTCLSEKMVDLSIETFRQMNSMLYVYSLNYPDLERLLKKKGFAYHDTQHVMKKKTTPTEENDVVQVDGNNAALWVDVFCKAYDCPDWAPHVSAIIENSPPSARYFVDKSGGSCMALYEKGSVLGLYCLGTVPDRRNQGLASLLVDFALNDAHLKGLESLILETYERDDLLGFYSNLGFEGAYCKKIFAI